MIDCVVAELLDGSYAYPSLATPITSTVNTSPGLAFSRLDAKGENRGQYELFDILFPFILESGNVIIDSRMMDFWWQRDAIDYIISQDKKLVHL